MSTITIMDMYYDEDQNLFVDANGFIIYNIFEYMTPNELLIFKKNGQYMITVNAKGQRALLMAPDFIPF